MKVGIVCPIPFGADGIFGGGTRYPQEFARAMRRWTDCELVTFGTEEADFEDEYGLRYRVARDLRRDRQTADPLSPAVIRMLADYDVVHFFVNNKIAVIGAAYARLRGAGTFMTSVGGGGAAGMGRFHTHRVFDGFPLISEYTKVTLPWIQTRPTVVVYGGGDAAGFPDLPSETTSRKHDRIVFVGRISAHKGIEVLIEALPSGAELIVCGEILDTEYAAHLRELAKGRRVDFLPPATDVEVSELYASATVSVLPSVLKDFRGVRHEHPELLGLVLLEAMWHSTPVVASMVGGVAEIVSEGKNGLLVDPGQPALWRSALSQLLEDPTLARRMGEAGRRAVEQRFTWHQVTAQTVDFYRAATSGGRNRRRMVSATR